MHVSRGLRRVPRTITWGSDHALHALQIALATILWGPVLKKTNALG